jgi:hypothetical protein
LAKFEDLNTAARLREVMRKVATDAIEEIYPRPRYATVISANPTTRKAVVQFPDEVTTFTLPCGSVMPLTGSTVRVAGRAGARYVDEVVTTPDLVLKTGDTMTGLLQLNSGLRIASGANYHDIIYGESSGIHLIPDVYKATPTRYIRIGELFANMGVWSNYNDLILGSNTGSVGLATAAGVKAYMDSSGIWRVDAHGIFSRALSGEVRIGAWTASAQYSAIESPGAGYLLIGNTFDTTTYLNSANSVALRTAGTNRLSIGTTKIDSTLEIEGPQFHGTNSSGADYSLAALIAGNSGAVGAMAIWASGVAAQFRIGSSVQDVYLRNSNDTGYPQLFCDVVDTSSERYKENVRDAFPKAKAGGAAALASPTLEAVKALRPVRYTMGIGTWGLIGDDGQPRPHECGRDCTLVDSECPNKQNETKERLGLVAEEVELVFPEAVVRGLTGEVEGIKVSALVAVLVQAVQDLTDKVAVLEGQLDNR